MHPLQDNYVVMRYIILGCPYTKMHDLHRALDDYGLPENIGIINAINIDQIASYGIYVGSKLIKFDNFIVSYVRYPYDLIPPHSKNYQLREETEFYKSIALLFDDIAINRIASTWALRNRAYSLSLANRFGAKVPPFLLLKDNKQTEIKPAVKYNNYAVKSIGNCFVSDEINYNNINKFISKEEDGGEVAYVFPASLLDNKELNEYLSIYNSAFAQMPVYGKAEYRCYFIGGQIIIYERENILRFDKSFASYYISDHELKSCTYNSIVRISESFSIDYVCFDVILDDSGVEWIVDINPYGSVPPYSTFPEVNSALATRIVEKINKFNDI